MDFYQIRVEEVKKGIQRLYPDWTVSRFKDLMVRAKSFYAVWDEEHNLWSTDEYDVQRLVDEDLHRYAKEAERDGTRYEVMNLKSFHTNVWVSFRRFMQNISDNSHDLDNNLTFANTETKRTDYVSRRLPYALEKGTTDAWDELLGVLYAQSERDKIEWAIGAVVAGDAKRIQKFVVFYGPAGSGKSTVLNIIQRLFEGYFTTFDARALGSSNGTFATEAFKNNPLVAIQHDGDLSRIDDNTKLNSIIAHEDMTMNEKFKPSYSSRVNAFLFMGTNQPVKISDAKSGIIRRLIDVKPTGKTIETDRYHDLMHQIDFELGAIAFKCLERYRELGKNKYSAYRPTEMMLQTDVFYNFVESYYDTFKSQDGISLKQAYELYREYCGYANVEKLLPQYKFREELRNYFETFIDKFEIDGKIVRSYYVGFKDMQILEAPVDLTYEIKLVPGFISRIHSMYPNQPAQYAKADGSPRTEWHRVTTTLAELDEFQLHWMLVPENHIVIDLDLVDEDGKKDFDLNLLEAAKFPPTYTETSQSGQGIHLHYLYSGDVHELANVYSPGIEIKTLLGGAALRRKFDLCNDLDVATIGSGLPKKEKKPMIENKSIQSERGLRDLIDRNLRKEILPGTKPSIDFIHKILEDAYDSGLNYDVRDLRPIIMTFAIRSTHRSTECIKTVQKMKFASEQPMKEQTPGDKPLVFYDVEVYSNLLIVCWKFKGDTDVVKMINPSPREVEPLFQEKLIGFNSRRYDNHILYARYLGWTLEEIFRLSQRIIAGNDRSLFGAAYDLSYTDVYDFSSKKQSLKKFQIELGIRHMELDLPWDQPVPDDRIQDVVDYCVNDVVSLEEVFNARHQDFVARSILAELSGLSVNHTTQQHTARIIFGEEKNPQSQFVYTELSEEFPGYFFDGKESTYRGEVTGEGGYVYAEPGIYENVTVLDVASMHPTSIERLNLFGGYTARFTDLLLARLAIKRGDLETLSGSLLGGKLAKFVGGTESDLAGLSYALKIVINIVYGLTSARFTNPFKDPRNVDNIVAKRGALFMIDLKHAVQEMGYDVVHIKTDSIKIPNADLKICEFIQEFGRKYGYDFEIEGTYERFCLINDAVYIARAGDKWTAVGAQFQHPYVYKALFSGEEHTFDDICETRNVVQGTMYLDFEMEDHEPTTETMVHIGRTGSFVPVKSGGGALWRVKDGKFYAVTGTKGYLWITRDVALQRYGNDEDITKVDVDFEYFDKLKQDAWEAIDYYWPFDKFVER